MHRINEGAQMTAAAEKHRYARQEAVCVRDKGEGGGVRNQGFSLPLLRFALLAFVRCDACISNRCAVRLGLGWTSLQTRSGGPQRWSAFALVA